MSTPLLRLPRPLAALAVFAALAAAGCDQRRTADANTCSLADFDPDGARTAGRLTGKKVTLYGDTAIEPYKIPNGRWITPLGTTVTTHPFSLRVAAHPGGRYYAVNNVGLGDFKSGYQSISFLDGVTGGTLKFTGQPKCPDPADHPRFNACDALPVAQLWGDMVWSTDGTKLYAAGGGANKVHVIATDPITAPVVAGGIDVPGYPTGLALLPGGAELLVTSFHAHKLHLVRLADGAILKSFTVQIYPYGVTTDGKLAYVSNLGSNSASRVDLTSGAVTSVTVGYNPEGVALSPDGKRLYVANSDSDTLSVVDTAHFNPAGVRTVSLKDAPGDAPGMSPVDVQPSRDGKRIYVALAGDNAVAVLDAVDFGLLGRIPTAWYTTTLALNPVSDQIAVVGAKGFGAGMNDPTKFYGGAANRYEDVFVGRLQKGAVTFFDAPADKELAELRIAVDNNNAVTRHLFKPEKRDCKRLAGPIPLEVGQGSPIKHVVYIVRENKTYDSDMGDYHVDPAKYPDLQVRDPKNPVPNRANGDPKLAIWGEKVTPNLHALAERFANHDNYYSEPEQSVQGHVWASNGWSNDFSEKVWIAMWSNKHDSAFLPAIEPASRGGNDGMIFNVLKAGNDIRIYGEVSGLADKMTSELRDKYNWKYPAWSLHIRDREKAKIFLEDVDKGIFPEFVYIWLPNDHTAGCKEGNPYPVSQIADNDEGTGMIIDGLSKSRFWKETAVFVFEDDPQSSPDHVDAHRSLLLVASPYAKRGWTSHAQVSFPSIHRTMELILGVPPTSRYEELATPLYDAFQETADMEPYDYIPLRDDMFKMVEKGDPAKVNIGGVEYFNCREMGAKFLTPSSLDMEDQMPGLGRILWFHAKGATPYPEALVADEDDK